MNSTGLQLQRVTAFVVAAIVGAGLLLWPAVMNGYPLLYYDTGAYIWGSIDRVVPPDRPIGYGLFLLTRTITGSLWIPTVLQAAITSCLLLRALLVVLPGSFRRRLIASSIVLLLTVVTTGVARYASYAMPDIFVGWLLLGSYLLLFGGRVDQVSGTLAILVAELVHNVNIGLGLVFAGVLLCAACLIPGLSWRRRSAPLAVCALGLVLASAVSVTFGGGFLPARGTPTFLVNQLSAAGLLSPVLARYCPEEQWELCQFQSVIARPTDDPSWFLWGNDSPLQHIGWEQSGGEQSDVVVHALQCCMAAVLGNGVESSWQQLWQFRANQDLPMLGADSSAYKAIQTVFPGEFAAFSASRQQSGTVPPVEIAATDDPRVFACFVGLATLLTVACWSRGLRKLALCLGVASVCVVINAFVVGMTNGVADRQQGRIVWMIPFWVFAGGLALISSMRAQRPSRRNITISVLNTMARSNSGVRWRM